MLHRLLDPIRTFGLGAGILYVTDRVLRRVSPKVGLRVYDFMAQPVTDKALLPPRFTRNLTFTEIDRGHPDLNGMPAGQEIRDHRFTQGATCLCVYRKHTLIGYIWLCFGAYREDEVKCSYVLPSPLRQAFDFDLYVVPEHRLGIGFLAIWHGANRYLLERGFEMTFSRISRFNLISRRLHSQLGAVCVGRGVFLQMWQVEVMLSTLRPYFAVVWGSRNVSLRLKQC